MLNLYCSDILLPMGCFLLARPEFWLSSIARILLTYKGAFLTESWRSSYDKLNNHLKGLVTLLFASRFLTESNNLHVTINFRM